jgi:hypothetical protein
MPEPLQPEQRLRELADDLASAIERALPEWVRQVTARASGDTPVDPASVAEAGRRAVAEVGPAVRALLARDVDEQRTNPLALVRRAVRHPTEVLRAAGVPPPARDEFAVRAFPDDVYDLSPATWTDLGAEVQEPGIMWGAAKAHVVLSRRKGTQ